MADTVVTGERWQTKYQPEIIYILCKMLTETDKKQNGYLKSKWIAADYRQSVTLALPEGVKYTAMAISK